MSLMCSWKAARRWSKLRSALKAIALVSSEMASFSLWLSISTEYQIRPPESTSVEKAREYYTDELIKKTQMKYNMVVATTDQVGILYVVQQTSLTSY
jgi:hypothetical protein